MLWVDVSFSLTSVAGAAHTGAVHHSGERWRLGHRPALDGLRGIAILLVLAAHTGAPATRQLGQPGVTAFFVLSGFLITSLLLEERQTTGRILLGRFWQRRARRLLPALFVCVGLVALVASTAGRLTEEWAWALSYVMNFVQAGRETYVGGFFGHTWSLAIEEQFYLLWPLALLACRRWRPSRLLAATLALAAASALVRFALVARDAPGPRVAYGTDVRAEALLLGCAIAIAFAHYRMPAARAGVIPAGLLGVLGSGYVAAPDTLSYTLAALSTGLVVYGIAGGAQGRLLSGRLLRRLGERSYGWYLWHVPVVHFVAIAMPHGSWWALSLIASPIAGVLVWASWRYVEEPFLRRRSLLDVARPPGELAGRARVDRAGASG